jgi:rhodanese-related sulfurtransferase
VAEAKSLVDKGAFLLDVREPSEWQEFHAPQATLIPLGELASRTAELPKDKKIVVICRSGNRSQQGRDILLEAGFENVTSVAGGMTEWQQAGYDTVAGN